MSIPEEKLDELARLETQNRRMLSREQANDFYLEVLQSKDTAEIKRLCLEDLFFLLVIACKRRDIDRDWLYARCREVEISPDGHLDLWAREHYKSTIITFGKSIQDLLRDPDGMTIGIFSHTRPIAKGFLEQIKRELEGNEFLKSIFPDVLHENPKSESPKWSLDSGLILKRKTNPKEANVEAWGLVDGQPTGKHFKLRVYDDVVTRESVTTPDQIKKTTAAWELSQNLGAQGGQARYIGTRYHQNDTYSTMMSRGSVITRIHTATENGKIDGAPVLFSQKDLNDKRRDMGPYTFGTQMLQDPVADNAMGFKPEWLKYYDSIGDISKWNTYIIVDPANAKKKSSDYTVMEVIALAPDNNYYLIEALRDRLNLTQKTKKLFELYRKYLPRAVGYEQYGMQADIEHLQYVMEIENFRFDITPLGGQMSKEDRIRKLVPVFEQKRFYMPRSLTFKDYEGKVHDYIKDFVEDEYSSFPVSIHDDMLDCRARILDPELGATFPKLQPTAIPQTIRYSPDAQSTGWMG